MGEKAGTMLRQAAEKRFGFIEEMQRFVGGISFDRLKAIEGTKI